jgi:type IV secretory pathway VirB2 component (pilin)
VSATPPSTPQLQSQRQTPIWTWIAFSLCALFTIALFFIPVFIIRPFTYQAPRALLLAMSLRQRGPLGTLVAALACVIFGLALWKTVGRWRKALIVLTLFLVAFSTVMVRLNHFEWMFHPIADPQFLAQSDCKLDPNEMIMAVRLASDARAYPISQMAYHHILNDVVGGVPIAVTY